MLSLLKRFDWLLLGSALFLTLVGLQAIYSLSLGEAGLTRFIKQLIALGLGLGLLWTLARFDYRRLGALSWLWYLVSLASLLAVLIFGTTLRGTKGWFVLGQFTFQPVELVKILLVVVLAYYLAQHGRGDKTRRIWLQSFGLLIPAVILLAWQPDLGPAALLLIIAFVLNVVRGLKPRAWLAIGLVAILVSLLSWQFVLNENQQARLTSLIRPSDPTGSDYQVRQSIIAVGSGGFLGRGLGEGYQSQLQFLPAAATDFMLASILEERGWLGWLVISAAFSLLAWRIWRLVAQSKDSFTLYLVLGLGLLLVLQGLINMAMNVGLAPVVGLPLPYVSYGGSALIGSLAIMGILLSVAVRQRTT